MIDTILETLLENRRQQEILKTGIDGYCPCCGAPNYTAIGQQHDSECIWHERDQERNNESEN